VNVAILSLVVAAAAGAAALLLELAWLRSASSALPGVVPAAVVVLPAFLLAWSAGSMVAGRLVDRAGSRCLLAARWLALGAVAAWLAPELLALAGSGGTPTSVGGRLVVGALPALPAAFALGGALPLLSRLRAAEGLAPARATGAVAAAVALGGAAGCHGWPELLGSGAPVSLLAALVLAAAAGLCWLLALAGGESTEEASEAAIGQAPAAALGPDAATRSTPLLPLAAFLAGALLVGGQVLLLRVGAQSAGATLSTTVSVLLWLHLGMAAGALLMSTRWRALPAESLTAMLLATAGLALAWPGGLAGLTTHSLDPTPAALLLGLGAGSVVTAASRAGRRSGARFGSWVGDLAALSTLGGMAGGYGAVRVLSEVSDTPTVLRGMALAALVTALVLGAVACGLAVRRVPAGLGLVLVLTASLVGFTSEPVEFPWRSHPDETELLARHEGPFGVTDLVATSSGGRRLKLDGRFGVGGGGSDTLARRLGRVAACFAPDAERALVLGMGAGHTLAGVQTTSRAEVDCVEHNPSLWETVELADLAAGRAPPPGPLPAREPTRPVELADARAWIAAHEGTYDLVVGDLFFPWLSGAGDLLAMEQLRSVRRSLTDEGVYVQWLPLHQLPWPAFGSAARGFAEVFPTARLVVATPLAGEPLVALVGGLMQGVPGQEAVDGLLADVPDPAGPNRWSEFIDLVLCDAWQLSEQFVDEPLPTLEHPVTELLSQGRLDEESLLAWRNGRLLSELVTPLTTSSLSRRPTDGRENRELGRELIQRAGVTKLLLLARAATGERATVDPFDPGERARRDALDHDIDTALLGAWAELPGHAAARAALLERASSRTRDGYWEEAATLLHGALERGRDVPLAAMLGGIFTRLGFLDEALALLEGARVGATPDRSLLLNLGAARLFAERPDDEVREALEAAAALGPLPPLHEAALALLTDRPGARESAAALASALGDDEAWALALSRLVTED
jgi:spermidine synthase